MIRTHQKAYRQKIPVKPHKKSVTPIFPEIPEAGYRQLLFPSFSTFIDGKRISLFQDANMPCEKVSSRKSIILYTAVVRYS